MQRFIHVYCILLLLACGLFDTSNGTQKMKRATFINQENKKLVDKIFDEFDSICDRYYKEVLPEIREWIYVSQLLENYKASESEIRKSLESIKNLKAIVNYYTIKFQSNADLKTKGLELYRKVVDAENQLDILSKTENKDLFNEFHRVVCERYKKLPKEVRNMHINDIGDLSTLYQESEDFKRPNFSYILAQINSNPEYRSFDFLEEDFKNDEELAMLNLMREYMSSLNIQLKEKESYKKITDNDKYKTRICNNHKANSDLKLYNWALSVDFISQKELLSKVEEVFNRFDRICEEYYNTSPIVQEFIYVENKLKKYGDKSSEEKIDLEYIKNYYTNFEDSSSTKLKSDIQYLIQSFIENYIKEVFKNKRSNIFINEFIKSISQNFNMVFESALKAQFDMIKQNKAKILELYHKVIEVQNELDELSNTQDENLLRVFYMFVKKRYNQKNLYQLTNIKSDESDQEKSEDLIREFFDALKAKSESKSSEIEIKLAKKLAKVKRVGFNYYLFHDSERFNIVKFQNENRKDHIMSPQDDMMIKIANNQKIDSHIKLYRWFLQAKIYEETYLLQE